MTRQRLSREFNSFTNGFISEANPLTFPENASIEINNFEIERTGKISRRFGMGYEEGFLEFDSGISIPSDEVVGVSAFDWENAGGSEFSTILVVQIGNHLAFFNTNLSSTSEGFEQSFVLEGSPIGVDYSMSSVDGLLVLVTGEQEVKVYEYDELQPIGSRVVQSELRIKTRDLFGVSAFNGTTDLRDSSNINKRPNPPSIRFSLFEHIYNLRNSTYAKSSFDGNDEDLVDPILAFVNEDDNEQSLLPSNADSTLSSIFSDPNDGGDRIVERYWSETAFNTTPFNTENPTGHFIIDALNRGDSRQEEVEAFQDTLQDEGVDFWPVRNLPEDRSPGGATVVAEFAGRMFYGGFSGELIDGDDYSPRLSSYIFFSTLVSSRSDLTKCYQIGDPTSSEEFDLVATDGGFIRVSGAYGINDMVNIGNSLVVLATNGVWAISGGSDFGFTALDYRVDKISEHGCISSDSAVLVDNSLIYWGVDGIYVVGPNEFGSVSLQNLSESTIQRFYENIPNNDKISCKGFFDSFERKVRWVYGNRIGQNDPSRELVFDLRLQAFYKNTMSGASQGLPNLIAPFEVPPFQVQSTEVNVVVGGDDVLSGTDNVHTTVPTRLSSQREINYLTVTGNSPTITYTFSSYNNQRFIDWEEFDGEGSDALAEMYTGYDGLQDFQRDKQVPQVFFHLERSETGYFEDELGDIYPTNPSSCKVQAQWGWSDSINAGRWGRTFEAYRRTRAYIPNSVNSSYDDGVPVITTRNKLRGKGKVLSLYISSQPLHDLRLLGWSMNTEVENNV